MNTLKPAKEISNITKINADGALKHVLGMIADKIDKAAHLGLNYCQLEISSTYNINIEQIVSTLTKLKYTVVTDIKTGTKNGYFDISALLTIRWSK